jgi:hypothetical protein
MSGAACGVGSPCRPAVGKKSRSLHISPLPMEIGDIIRVIRWIIARITTLLITDIVMFQVLDISCFVF